MDMLITNFTKSQHRQTFTGKNIAVRLNEQMNFACLKLKFGHKQILVWSMEKKNWPHCIFSPITTRV